MQNTQVHYSWVWGYAKAGGKSGWKWWGGRGRRTMGSTGGFRWKPTSRKCAMARVPLEAVCVLPKIEPGQSPICIPHTLMWWFSTGHRHIRRIFYCCDHGQWVLERSGGRIFAWKTDIIHPRLKVAVERDNYGGHKRSSNICNNKDEDTNGIWHTI